jgi:hypothetical protein
MDTQKNCYAVSGIEKIAAKTKLFMDNIIPLLKTDQQEAIITEYTSELIYAVLGSSSSVLISHFHKDIKANFYRDEFFQMGYNTLKCWTKIIHLMCFHEPENASSQNNLYFDLLQRYLYCLKFNVIIL